ELDRRGLKIRILNKPSWRLSQLVANPSSIERAPLVGALVSERFNSPILRKLQQAQVRLWARSRPHIVWLTWPNLLEAVPVPLLRSVRLVYDCMDLSGSFPGTPSWRRRITSNEQLLLSHKPVVFASSLPIASHLALQNPLVDVHIVPNGFDPSVEWSQTEPQRGTALVLGYFGTIAEWFD